MHGVVVQLLNSDLCYKNKSFATIHGCKHSPNALDKSITHNTLVVLPLII